MVFNCQICGKEVIEKEAWFNQTKQHFCSYKCYWKSKRKQVRHKCRRCRKSFFVWQSIHNKKLGKYCSKECRRIYQFEHKKSRKEIWTKYNRKVQIKKRKWHEKKQFDGNATIIGKSCILCKKTMDLIIHHKDGNNGRMGKSLNNQANNLVVLCRKCHAKAHYKGEITKVGDAL